MKHATGELSFNQLDQVSGGSGHRDSLGDLGMEQQIRLQMHMDAFSKSSATISNVLKKFSDAASQITQNMK